MEDSYQLKLTYPKTYSLHRLTSLVESVDGVRIRHLNFISFGWKLTGDLAFEAAERDAYDLVIDLLRSSHEIFIEKNTEIAIAA
jgi:hypothetical protein